MAPRAHNHMEKGLVVAGDAMPVDESNGVPNGVSNGVPNGGVSLLQRLTKAEGAGDPLRLDFHISYTVQGKKQGNATREILKGVNGCLRPGRLTAILGPSGAGKTSVLSILSGHRTKGVRGRILVNGRQGSCRHLCTLIAQEFALLGALTVGETLRIATELKLYTKCSAKDREDVVSDIVAILGLEACVNTSVANLSGGEKKRVSIGVELVTNPPVMFFDEPTSGLDSVSSVQVISHLHSLARAGRTVAVVLHQPSSRLFQLFDDLLVLSAGRTLYCGSTADAAGTFGAAGFACPTFYNIADFVVEVASGEHGHDLDALVAVVESGSVLKELDATPSPDGDAETDPMLRKHGGAGSGRSSSSLGLGHEKADVIVDLEKMPPRMPRPSIVAAGKKAAAPGRVYPVPFWVQFIVLFKRSLLVSLRDMNMAWLRFAVHLIVAGILGLLYKDIGDEASKVSGNVACLFFFILFLFFSNAMPTVLTFPLEAAVFFREHSNNWYSMPAYYLSKALADLPFMVVNPTVFLLTAYYLTDQPTDSNRRCMVWLVCVLTVLLAHAYGLVFGAAFGMQLGIFLVPAATIPLILFSGFFLYIPDIPVFLRWLAYVSNFRYGFEGIVITTYGMDRQPLKCSLPYCHWRRPNKFLEDIGMLHADYWFDVSGLVVWIAILHVLLLVTLKVRVILSRR